MKRKVFTSKYLRKQKKIYYILIGLAIIGIIFGLLFIFLISNENKSLLNTRIKDFFDNDIDIFKNFFKCLFNNLILILIVWILGISIIGIPLILIILFLKSFIFGFSISSLISTFGVNGLLISLFHIVISKSIYLIILILMSFYSISFSIKLLKSFFTKKSVDFKESIRKYIKVLLLSLVVCFIISIYEGFISNYIVNFFY